MFNNLIESGSHQNEFKRRGSFFLITTAAYAVLLVLAGVASIYAYDAQLRDQDFEVVTMLPPVDLAPATPKPAKPTNVPPKSSSTKQVYAERQVAMLSVNHPEVVPPNVSAAPSKALPLPETGLWRLTGRDVDPVGPVSAGGTGNGNGQPTQPVHVVTEIETPPPAEIHKPMARVVSKGVITSQALSLPKPVYSAIAKQMKIQGVVSVQVLIDETGKVVSAKALAGSPILTGEAQKAAMQARFSPTLLGDQPVKVSGVITYNFVLQ
jgi:TonB family protein